MFKFGFFANNPRMKSMVKVKLHDPFETPLHHLTALEEADSIIMEQELNQYERRDKLRAL